MKERTTEKSEIPFAGLKWGDLEHWVGVTILQRGKSYLRRVQDLEITEDDQLIATVIGREPYVTRVWMEDGEPDYECSCPYWGACKHAIAVILAYLECIKSKTHVPMINPHELEARLSVYGMADEQDNESGIDLEQTRAALKTMTKAQLIEWAIGVFMDDPSLIDTLPTLRQSVDVLPEKIIANLRQQIRKTTNERGWQNHWDNQGYIPDYSMIQKQLTMLSRSGHIDAVLELGEELFTLGNVQISESDDDGGTAEEIIGCFEVVFEALKNSQKPAAERMIWFWDKLLHDEFALFDSIEPPVDNITMTKADWQEVAEEFSRRLADCPKLKKQEGWSSNRYRRQQALRYTVKALAQAGKNKRAIQLMIAELPYCDNYIELADYLLINKDYEQAEHWAYQGFSETIDSSPGIAWKLVDRLLAIERKRENWLQTSALQVFIFLHKPSVDNYRLIQKASSKADCWPQVKANLLEFLETGASPLTALDWPLPNTALKFLKSKSRQKSPDYNTLIDIALHEKRTEDALYWFQQTPNKSFHAEEIAQAVKTKYPDVSFRIWRGKAEALIAKVKPNAYRDAMHYLKKMKSLMQHLKRGDEYQRYIARLRQQHKAKRKLMEELDALDNMGKKNQRILDS